MTLETWYLIFLWGWRISLGLVVVVLTWHCIANLMNEGTEHKKSLIAFAVAGILAACMTVGYLLTEAELFPPGECPNCDKQITTRYCEDCGWQNDSYFENTDRK